MEKLILISGSSGLLGKEFSKTLFAEKYRVIGLDISEPILFKNLTHFYKIDLIDKISIKNIFTKIVDKFGFPSVFIHCAAYNPPPNERGVSYENYLFTDWERALKINLTSFFTLSQECIKYMLKNETKGFKGTIIAIASDLGIITSDQRIYKNGYVKPPCYGVSKAGILHLTKYIAGYYRDSIKSVALSPGSVYNGQSDELKENLENKIPLGRLAGVEEYNGAIKFLCSSDSDYMQGQNLIMDGGRSIW